MKLSQELFLRSSSKGEDKHKFLASLLVQDGKARFPVLTRKMAYPCEDRKQVNDKVYTIIDHLNFIHSWGLEGIGKWVQTVEDQLGIENQNKIPQDLIYEDSETMMERFLAKYPQARTDYNYLFLKWWQVFNGSPLDPDKWYKKLAKVETLSRLRRKVYESRASTKSQIEMFKEK